MEDYGRMYDTVSRKRQIDTWKFSSPFKDEASREAEYVARLYLVRNSAGTRLRVESSHFDAMEHTDIGELRKLAEQRFREKDMLSRAVVWEDWIELEIADKHYFRDEQGACVDVRWSFLRRGVHPDTGEAYTINNNGIVVKFPKPKAVGAVDDVSHEGKWAHTRETSHQFSYAPATPENIAALKELEARAQALRDRLCHLLVQERVQQSLSGQFLALPPGEN